MSSVERFSHQRYITLETYAKGGRPVRTPVFVIEDGGRIYVRTDPRTWKVKRIQTNSRVRIAPSDGRGRTRGEWSDGEARVIKDQEVVRILALFKKKYGLFGVISDSLNRLRGLRITAVIEITLE